MRVNFGTSSSLRDILNFIGTATGINITYDQQFVDKPYSVNLDGVTIEEALQQVLSANGYYYKVINPRTIIVIPDQPAKHQQYRRARRARCSTSRTPTRPSWRRSVNTIMRIPQMAVQPMVMPNKTANTITVRATAPGRRRHRRIIRANDKPRAEVVLDVEILEVESRAHQALRHQSEPVQPEPAVLAGAGAAQHRPADAVTAPPPFNLNTITQGVSTADFYLGVPTAVVNFLESDCAQPDAGEAAAPRHRRADR